MNYNIVLLSVNEGVVPILYYPAVIFLYCHIFKPSNRPIQKNMKETSESDTM